jgi:hypothetical protein
MSHFVAFVVTPEFPTQAVLNRALAPWHSFARTEFDEKYVVEIDKTEEARAEFEQAEEIRIRDGGGKLHNPYDERGQLKPEFTKSRRAGLRWLFQRLLIPKSFEKVTVRAADVTTFAKWASINYGWTLARSEGEIDPTGTHKGGYVLVDGKGSVIRCVGRGNPNAKWDWWHLGGRYSGRLAAGYDPDADPDNIITCSSCEGTGDRTDAEGNDDRAAGTSDTCDVCGGRGEVVKSPYDLKNVGNTARWGDVDLAALKAGHVADRRNRFEEKRRESGLTYDEFERGLQAYRAAKSHWDALPDPKPSDGAFADWLLAQPSGDVASAYHSADRWQSVEPGPGQSIADWIEAAPPITSYAAVVNGEWHAEGEMGWFAMSFNNKSDWSEQFQELLSSIPADHYVSFIDCHI